MQIQTPCWITDISLQQRLKEAVALMIRGKGKLNNRVQDAMQYLCVLQVNDFPKKHHEMAGLLLGILSKGEVKYNILGKSWYIFRPTLKQIKLWQTALLDLYEDLLVDLGKYDPDMHCSYLDIPKSK